MSAMLPPGLLLAAGRHHITNFDADSAHHAACKPAGVKRGEPGRKSNYDANSPATYDKELIFQARLIYCLTLQPIPHASPSSASAPWAAPLPKSCARTAHHRSASRTSATATWKKRSRLGLTAPSYPLMSCGPMTFNPF